MQTGSTQAITMTSKDISFIGRHCVPSPAPVQPQRLGILQRALLLGPVVVLTMLFGGARPWVWQGVASLFFIGLAAWTALHKPFPPLMGRRAPLGAACLLCIPALQAIPLPHGVQDFLSPARSSWAHALRELGAAADTSLSYDPLATWIHLTWWLFLMAFAGLLFHAMTTRATKTPVWLLHALFLLAAFEALYGILQTLIPSLGVLWDIAPDSGLAYTGCARGTFINRNHFAAFLGLLWPLLLVYLIIIRNPRKMEFILGERARAQDLAQKKAFGGFCLGLIVLALIFSQSRGAILAALLSFTLLSLLAGMRQRRVLMALGTCWVIALAYGTVIGFDGVTDRFAQIDRDASARFEIWQDAWQAALDHPLSGTGLGTYPSVGRAYQNAVAPQMRASHAHNDYLETTVELGLPAASLLVAAIWGLWWHRALLLWRRRDSLDEDRLLLGAASLAALGGYLLHAWVEFNNAVPVNHLAAVMVATLHFAVLHKSSRPTPEQLGHQGQTSRPLSFPEMPDDTSRGIAKHLNALTTTSSANTCL